MEEDGGLSGGLIEIVPSGKDLNPVVAGSSFSLAGVYFTGAPDVTMEWGPAEGSWQRTVGHVSEDRYFI